MIDHPACDFKKIYCHYWFSAEKHHLDVMACLIRHGADPDEPNLFRKTAYELAGCDESQFAETATRRRFGY